MEREKNPAAKNAKLYYYRFYRDKERYFLVSMFNIQRKYRKYFHDY
jgi:hypothetical protein